MLEVADRAIGLRTIEAIDRAVIVAAAGKLALDIIDDFTGTCAAQAAAATLLGAGTGIGSTGLGRGGAGSVLSATVAGFAGDCAPLKIGAGCAPGCMSSTLTTIAVVAKTTTTMATASRALKPSDRQNRRQRPSAASLIAARSFPSLGDRHDYALFPPRNARGVDRFPDGHRLRGRLSER